MLAGAISIHEQTMSHNAASSSTGNGMQDQQGGRQQMPYVPTEEVDVPQQGETEGQLPGAQGAEIPIPVSPATPVLQSPPALDLPINAVRLPRQLHEQNRRQAIANPPGSQNASAEATGPDPPGLSTPTRRPTVRHIGTTSPRSPLGAETNSPDRDDENDVNKTDTEKLMGKMSDVIMAMNKQITMLTTRLEQMDEEKRHRDNPDRLKEINYKDISKPGKYSGTGWSLWSKNFSSFLERRDKRWPKLLASISSRSAGPPLNDDAKNMIAVDLGIYKEELMEAFTNQLFDYLQEYTSGDVLTTILAGGKTGSWETWRSLSEAGKSRQKVNLKEEHRKLMHPKQVELEILLKTIHAWESELADHVQSGGKAIPDDERIMCIEEICPAPLQEYLAEKAETDEEKMKTYDQYKTAIAAYVTRKLRRSKTAKPLKSLQPDGDGEQPEVEDEDENNAWKELGRLCSINGDIYALVNNKFDNKRGKGKGFGKGGKAGKGSGNGATPMEVDHSGKDCYECGELGHIGANCPQRQVRLATEAKGGGKLAPGGKAGKGSGKQGPKGGKGPGKGQWRFPSLPQWQQMYPGPSQAQWKTWWQHAQPGKMNLFETPQQLSAMEQVWNFVQPNAEQGHSQQTGLKALFSGGTAYAFKVKDKKTNSAEAATVTKKAPQCECPQHRNRFAAFKDLTEEHDDEADSTPLKESREPWVSRLKSLPAKLRDEDAVAQHENLGDSANKMDVALMDAIKPMSKNRERKQHNGSSTIPVTSTPCTSRFSTTNSSLTSSTSSPIASRRWSPPPSTSSSPSILHTAGEPRTRIARGKEFMSYCENAENLLSGDITRSGVNDCEVLNDKAILKTDTSEIDGNLDIARSGVRDAICSEGPRTHKGTQNADRAGSLSRSVNAVDPYAGEVSIDPPHLRYAQWKPSVDSEHVNSSQMDAPCSLGKWAGHTPWLCDLRNMVGASTDASDSLRMRGQAASVMTAPLPQEFTSSCLANDDASNSGNAETGVCVHESSDIPMAQGMAQGSRRIGSGHHWVAGGGVLTESRDKLQEANELLDMLQQGIHVSKDHVSGPSLKVLRDTRAIRLYGMQNQADLKDASGKWEKLSAVVDSGATITAVSPKTGRGYKVEESEASKAGVEYECANKETLPNLGEKSMAVMTKEGTLRGFKAQVADVAGPLESVRQLLSNKHCVLFGLGEEGEQHLIVNKVSGEVNFMRDDGVNYLHDMLIVPPDEVENAQKALQQMSPFGRQA